MESGNKGRREAPTWEDENVEKVYADCRWRPRSSRPAWRARPLPRRPVRDFFNGKTVNYIVATDPGGGYDTNGRLVAEFMQKHLPGSTFVVQNMPGAGHLIGANYIYASEPDGLTIGTFNTGLIYSQLVGQWRHQIRSRQDVVDRQGRFRSARHRRLEGFRHRELRAAEDR